MNADRIRTETEINLNWAQKNPHLFTRTIVKFMKDHPQQEWVVSIDLPHPKVMILIANRKQALLEGSEHLGQV